MCDFCNNILKLSQFNKIPPYQRKYVTIIKYPNIQDSCKYGLWVECDDPYYSSIKMDIYYCPLCGRKLNEN